MKRRQASKASGVSKQKAPVKPKKHTKQTAQASPRISGPQLVARPSIVLPAPPVPGQPDLPPTPVHRFFRPRSRQITYTCTYEELIALLESKQVQITLGNDIIVNQNIVIDYDVAIDFNGHSLIADQTVRDLRVLDIRRGEVTLTGNGKIFALGPNNIAIRVFGAISSSVPNYTRLTVDEDIHLYAPEGSGLLIAPNLGAAYGATVEFMGEIIARSGICLSQAVRGLAKNIPEIHIKNGARIIADEIYGSAVEAAGLGNWHIDSAKLFGVSGINLQQGNIELHHTQIIASDTALCIDAAPKSDLRVLIDGGIYISETGLTLTGEPEALEDLIIKSGDFCGAAGIFDEAFAKVAQIQDGRFSTDVVRVLRALAPDAEWDLKISPDYASEFYPVDSAPVASTYSDSSIAEATIIDEYDVVEAKLETAFATSIDDAFTLVDSIEDLMPHRAQPSYNTTKESSGNTSLAVTATPNGDDSTTNTRIATSDDANHMVDNSMPKNSTYAREVEQEVPPEVVSATISTSRQDATTRNTELITASQATPTQAQLAFELEEIDPAIKASPRRRHKTERAEKKTKVKQKPLKKPKARPKTLAVDESRDILSTTKTEQSHETPTCSTEPQDDLLATGTEVVADLPIEVLEAWMEGASTAPEASSLAQPNPYADQADRALKSSETPLSQPASVAKQIDDISTSSERSLPIVDQAESAAGSCTPSTQPDDTADLLAEAFVSSESIVQLPPAAPPESDFGNVSNAQSSSSEFVNSRPKPGSTPFSPILSQIYAAPDFNQTSPSLSSSSDSALSRSSSPAQASSCQPTAQQGLSPFTQSSSPPSLSAQPVSAIAPPAQWSPQSSAYTQLSPTAPTVYHQSAPAVPLTQNYQSYSGASIYGQPIATTSSVSLSSQSQLQPSAQASPQVLSQSSPQPPIQSIPQASLQSSVDTRLDSISPSSQPPSSVHSFSTMLSVENDQWSVSQTDNQKSSMYPRQVENDQWSFSQAVSQPYSSTAPQNNPLNYYRSSPTFTENSALRYDYGCSPTPAEVQASSCNSYVSPDQKTVGTSPNFNSIPSYSYASPDPELAERESLREALSRAIFDMRKLRAEDYLSGFSEFRAAMLATEMLLSDPETSLSDIRDAASDLISALDQLEEADNSSLTDRELDQLFYHGAVLKEATGYQPPRNHNSTGFNQTASSIGINSQSNPSDKSGASTTSSVSGFLKGISVGFQAGFAAFRKTRQDYKS